MFIIALSILVFIALFVALGFERTQSERRIVQKRNSRTGELEDVYADEEQPVKTVWKLRKIQALSPLAILMIGFSMFTTVQGNEVGIVYNPLAGGIQDTSLGEGLHIKAPWVRVYRISTRLREESFEMTAQTGKILRFNESTGEMEETGGGQWATYDVTFQYRVETINAHRFYRNFGGNLASVQTLQARIRAALQENSVKYDVFTILKGGIVEVRSGTFEDLIESMSSLGITVENFIIEDVDAGPAIEKVVEDEATAAKQAEIAVKEQEAALIREETIKLQAEIQAERILITANAEAEAQVVLNSVTVNAIVNMYLGQFGELEDTATPDIYGYLTMQEISAVVLAQLYYDAWNGELPQVIAGEDGLSLILPSLGN